MSMRQALPADPRNDGTPGTGSAAVRVSGRPARTASASLVRALCLSPTGEAGLGGSRPASDGAVCEGLRDTAAIGQRAGSGGVLRFGLARRQSIDKASPWARITDPDWTQVRHLAMNEFVFHKGYRYAAVVGEPLNCQILWIGPGRSRENRPSFFRATSRRRS